MPIRVPRGWEIPEREATPEAVYWDRRRFLRDLGFGGFGLAALSIAGIPPRAAWAARAAEPFAPRVGGGYPAPRNPQFRLDRPLTEEAIAAKYNNFYEFSTAKDVWRHTGGFKPRPWQIEIKGLVGKPVRLHYDDLLKRMPIEERLYRHRCVEAWAMAVPWTGFTLRALLDLAEPSSSATHLAFKTFLRPEQAPGQKNETWWPWPYFEALTLEEARNELAFIATGIYGHDLPAQHGAPLRLVTPWKYGFKSIKSIVEIELTDSRPGTFWSQAAPSEYGFWANVNPDVPHPRWSQAQERLLGPPLSNEIRPTQLFNGYARWVAELYGKDEVFYR